MITDEEIKNVITEGYKNILERDPDPDGLTNYIQEIKNGLTIEQFHGILKASGEYKQKLSSQKTITYCMIGTNRLYEITSYIETTLPYIDRFIFIDGGSVDGTVEFLKSLNNKYDDKIEIYVYEQQDKLSQRNNYLKHFAEKQNSGWILVSDTDEHYPIETLSGLRDTIKSAEAEGYNGVKFQIEDIIIDNDDYGKILERNINQYWKPLLFRYYSNIRYEEKSEFIVGFPIKWKQVNFTCQHIQYQIDAYKNAVENFFMSNSNTYSAKWSSFRFLCTRNDILKFDDFFKLYKEGKLPKEIESWMYNHRYDNEHIGDSEIRKMTKSYFEKYSDKDDRYT